jgi:hypothetical protein
MRSLKSLLTILVATVLVSCGGGGGCASSAECSTAAATAASGTAVPSFAAIAVSVGFDGTLSSVDADKRYGKTFAVSVADANGFAVAGAVVTPEVSIPKYYKGFFTRTTDFSVTGYTSFECPNEDVNRNDILDAGEDLNFDGEISPRQSLVTVSPVSGVTNSAGVAFFEVRYFKNYATWMQYQFKANVAVNTTEGSASQLQFTQYIIGDEIVQQTPFLVSPWGGTSSCANRL